MYRARTVNLGLLQAKLALQRGAQDPVLWCPRLGLFFSSPSACHHMAQANLGSLLYSGN